MFLLCLWLLSGVVSVASFACGCEWPYKRWPFVSWCISTALFLAGAIAWATPEGS